MCLTLVQTLFRLLGQKLFVAVMLPSFMRCKMKCWPASTGLTRGAAWEWIVRPSPPMALPTLPHWQVRTSNPPLSLLLLLLPLFALILIHLLSIFFALIVFICASISRRALCHSLLNLLRKYICLWPENSIKSNEFNNIQLNPTESRLYQTNPTKFSGNQTYPT